MRPSRSANVVSVGLWVDAEASTPTELAADLVTHELLTLNSTIGLLATGQGIRTIAEAQYATVDKSQGRVRLDEGIQIGFNASGMTAVVTGALDIFGPDPNFTVTLTQRMTLAPPGSDPPINVTNSQHVSASLAAKLVISAIAGLGGLGWLGGAVAFLALDPIASSVAPSVSLASVAWPSKVLTPAESPLLGKLDLTWTELTISEAGILTRGVFDNVARSPSVSIRGPKSVTVLEANPIERAAFSAIVDDLRSPLSVAWTGDVPGALSDESDGLVRRLVFTSAGTANIGVDIIDADQLTASDDIRVKVTMKELEDGQQPF